MALFKLTEGSRGLLVETGVLKDPLVVLHSIFGIRRILSWHRRSKTHFLHCFFVVLLQPLQRKYGSAGNCRHISALGRFHRRSSKGVADGVKILMFSGEASAVSIAGKG